MKLSNLAVNRPIAVLMAVITVILLGGVSLSKLTLDLFPKMTFPIAVVATNYQGSAPEEVERLITRPLEEALGTVNNVKEISSFSQPGSSMVIVEFNWGTDMDFATLQMREKVDLAKRMLPNEVTTPQVLKFDPSSLPIFTLAVSGGENLVDLRRVVEDKIKSKLERQEGVASVNVSGGQSREIRISIDQKKMSNYGLALNQINQTLGAENMDFSAGSIREGSQELIIRIIGQFDTVEQIENLSFLTKAGSTVMLKEFAKVEDTFAKQTKLSTMNGKPSIGIDIQKQTDANTVSVSNQVLAAIEEMKSDLPKNIELNIIFDQASFINQSIDTVINNIIYGGLLAVAVLFLFLRNFRSTLVIAISMPISIIATFTMVYFGGLTLNMLSLGGLALGVGMMVDASIVILENIFRYRQEGFDHITAAKKGASEVGNAVIASALTTVAVFLPIVFVDGLAAELFRPLALTVSFSLLASLVVALTLIPMLSSKLLVVESKSNEEKKIGRIVNFFGKMVDSLDVLYRKVLEWSIKKKKAVIAGVIITFIASLGLIPVIGTELIPSMDQGQIQINVTLPDGALFEETNEVVLEIEENLNNIPSIETLFTSVGSGGAMDFSDSARTNTANIQVNLVELSKRNISTEQIVEQIGQLVANIPGAEIEVSAMDAGMGGMAAPVEIAVSGDDLETLKEITNDVIKVAEQIDGLREMESSFSKGMPELEIKVLKDKAALNGLSSATIASTARSAFQGDIVTVFKTGSDEINVKVILDDAKNKSIHDIENLEVATPMGTTVFLEEVAEVNIIEGPSTINRSGQTRQVTVQGTIVGRDLGSVVEDLQAKLDKMALPEGYSLDIGGQSEDMAEAFGDLTLALILAIILVYMIMAAQFEALLHPFVIMFSVPVTFIGIAFGLVVTGRSFSVTAFIGVIMLAGIVVNNAIVLVDYINILRKEGMTMEEAILKAGPTRLRPILMTTLTTVLGLVPLTLGIGEGAETQAPMATVVVFGLTFSTIITLVLVPVMYIILDDLGANFKYRIRKVLRKERA